MERRNINAEVRIGGGQGKKRIHGTAAVFYDPKNKGTEYSLAAYGLPNAVERIMPGAFKRALGRGQGGTRDRNQDAVCCINHDPSRVFARAKAGTLKLKVDAAGLHYVATPSDTTSGRDAIAHAEAGDFGGSSFAFTVAPNGERWTKDGELEVREITKIEELVDVSPVTTPAYRASTVAARDGLEVRASYDNWKNQLKQDLGDLEEINRIIGDALNKKADDDEPPAPIDGECPAGYTYDPETETCVKDEAEPETDEAEMAERVRRMRAALIRSELRHVVSVEETDDSIVVVFAKHHEEAEEAADPVPVDGECPDGWTYDAETETCVADAPAENEYQAARATVARLCCE